MHTNLCMLDARFWKYRMCHPSDAHEAIIALVIARILSTASGPIKRYMRAAEASLSTHTAELDGESMQIETSRERNSSCCFTIDADKELNIAPLISTTTLGTE